MPWRPPSLLPFSTQWVGRGKFNWGSLHSLYFLILSRCKPVKIGYNIVASVNSLTHWFGFQEQQKLEFQNDSVHTCIFRGRGEANFTVLSLSCFFFVREWNSKMSNCACSLMQHLTIICFHLLLIPSAETAFFILCIIRLSSFLYQKKEHSTTHRILL